MNDKAPSQSLFECAFRAKLSNLSGLEAEAGAGGGGGGGGGGGAGAGGGLAAACNFF